MARRLLENDSGLCLLAKCIGACYLGDIRGYSMNNTPSTATREEFIGSCNIVIRSCGSDAHAIRVATELKRLLEQQPAVTVSEGDLRNKPTKREAFEWALRAGMEPRENGLMLANGFYAPIEAVERAYGWYFDSKNENERLRNTRIEQQAAESFKIVGFDPASPNGDRSAIVIQFPDGTVQTFLSATAPQSNTQQAVTVPKDVCSALASLFSKLDGEDKDTLNWLLDARRYALAYSPSASPGTNDYRKVLQRVIDWDASAPDDWLDIVREMYEVMGIPLPDPLRMSPTTLGTNVGDKG
jgi:hypothetical protein